MYTSTHILCRSFSVKCSLTQFYDPTYSDDDDPAPSFLCVRDVSASTVELNVSAALTFDGVIPATAVYRWQLYAATDDTVEFHFTAEDIRGQFGKWVCSYDMI